MTQTDNSWLKCMVRGYKWKCKMSNDAVFEIWTPKEISKKEANKKLLLEANGDYRIVVYLSTDILNTWRLK